MPASSTTLPGERLGRVPPGTEHTLLVLGGDGPLGRDELLRLLDGGRVSLEVAVGATLLALLLGLIAGACAGFYGGWIDSVISRAADLVMAFPLLLMLILVGSTIGPRLTDITFGFLQHGVVSLVLTIALFTWFYPARIVRGEIAALKEREFVESARMIGAKEFRILRHHLLPHVVPVLLAYSAFLVATNVLVEAASLSSASGSGCRRRAGGASCRRRGERAHAVAVRLVADDGLADGLPVDRDLPDGRVVDDAWRRAAPSAGAASMTFAYVLRRIAVSVLLLVALDVPHVPRLRGDPREPRPDPCAEPE